MLFVLVATTFPMLSEASRRRERHRRPALLQRVGPAARPRSSSRSWASARCSAGRRPATTPSSAWPSIAPTVAMVICHRPALRARASRGLPGRRLGRADLRRRARRRSSASQRGTPVMGFALVVFNAAIIIQEYVLLFRSRAHVGRRQRRRRRSGTWASPSPRSRCVGLVLMRSSFTSTQRRRRLRRRLLGARRARRAVLPLHARHAPAHVTPSLRRLHRALRPLLHVPRLHREVVDRRPRDHDQPAADLRSRGLHAQVPGPAQRGRQHEAHDLRRRRGAARRQGARHADPGEVHLQEDARVADDRGVDDARAPRRPLPGRGQRQPADAAWPRSRST